MRALPRSTAEMSLGVARPGLAGLARREEVDEVAERAYHVLLDRCRVRKQEGHSSADRIDALHPLRRHA